MSPKDSISRLLPAKPDNGQQQPLVFAQEVRRTLTADPGAATYEKCKHEQQEELMTDHLSYPRPQHPHGEDDRLLTIEEVAELTRICVATLRWMRHTGTGPHSLRPARRILYWLSDVLDWIDRNYNNGPQPA